MSFLLNAYSQHVLPWDAFYEIERSFWNPLNGKFVAPLLYAMYMKDASEVYLEVSDIITDLLDRVRDDHNTHAGQVTRSHLEDSVDQDL